MMDTVYFSFQLNTEKFSLNQKKKKSVSVPIFSAMSVYTELAREYKGVQALTQGKLEAKSIATCGLRLRYPQTAHTARM